MATATTRNLKLRLTPGLTVDAVYNLQRLDEAVGNQIYQALSGMTYLRAPNGITIEPNSADVGGSGSGGVLNLGTSSHTLDSINLYATNFLVNGNELVYLTLPQTVTNKTLTASVFDGSVNTFSNIAYNSLILTNSIKNSDVAATAAIAYSKLNLSNSIMGSDISATAAIPYYKLNLAASITNADLAPNTKKTISGTSGRVTVAGGVGASLEDVTLNVDTNLLPSPTGGDIAYVLTVTGAGTAAWAATQSTHNPVTIGTANGLSLVGQVLSLALAGSGVTGALSGTDWDTFNGKQAALTIGNLTGTTNRLSVTGGTGAVIGSGVSLNIDTNLLPQPLVGDIGKTLVVTGANTAVWTALPAVHNAVTIGSPANGLSIDGHQVLTITAKQDDLGAAAPLVGDTGKALVATGAGTSAWTTVSSADEKVKVSSGDTTPGFLDAKLLAGANITLTKGNAGGNETYTIAGSASTPPGGLDTYVQFNDGGSAFGGSAGFTWSKTKGLLKVAAAGAGNVFIGLNAGSSYDEVNLTGEDNTALGSDSLTSLSTTSNNTAIGSNTLKSATGVSNTALGAYAGGAITSGNRNTAIGRGALNALTTGSGNVALGYYAGKYATGSNEFYVDNQDRTNTAGDKAKALMYGVFAATAASQLLTINAGTTINGTLGATNLSGTNTGDTPASGVAGAVQYANGTGGAFSSDAAAFFWDAANKRLGVGTNTPAAKVHAASLAIGSIPIIAQGFLGQTANLTEWQNSSGTVLSKINASGQFGFGGDPVYSIDSRATTGGAGIRSASDTSGDILYYGTGTVTGNINFFRSAVSATGSVESVIGNANTTSLTAKAVHQIFTGGAGAGDPILNLSISGVQDWSIGVDNSDLDKLKISPASSVETNTAMVITTGGLVGIGVSPTANLHVYSAADTVKAILREGPAQTAKLQEWRDASDNVFASISYSATSNHAVMELRGLGYSYFRCTRGTIAESAGNEYQTIVTGSPVKNWFIGTIENSNKYRWYSYGITAPVMELGYDNSDARLVVRGGAAQTGCLQEWQDSTSGVLASVCALGRGTFTGLNLGIRTVTSAPTIVGSDYTILCDATTAGFTVALPAAATNSGRIFNIKKIDSTVNPVVIDGNASETIDGALTYTINEQNRNIQLQCSGSAWYVI